MIHNFKGPLVALALFFSFLGLLAFQDPMTTTLSNGTTIKRSLPEIASGCQPIEEVEFTNSAYEASSDLARINPPNSDFEFSNIGEIVKDGNIIILYDNNIEEAEYNELRSAALTSLTESLTPIYLVPYTDGPWETRGAYELYGVGYMQECVEPSPAVFDLFWKYISTT